MCSYARNACYLQHPVCTCLGSKQNLMYLQVIERYRLTQNYPTFSTVGENAEPSQEFCYKGTEAEQEKH